MNRLQELIHAHRGLVVSLAVVIRIALVIYGTIQDELFDVKYSDVDYAVVTDAARFVVEGKSPYERTTYRYTPLLAYLMMPNVTFHPSFGKFVFVAFDFLAAWGVYRLVLASGLAARQANLASIAWLWNPLSMTISTRGSGDSIICTLVILTLLGLVNAKHNKAGQYDVSALAWLILGGLAHGVSVHWRLYPIIFAPTILLYLDNWPHRVLFGAVSAYVFFILGIMCYMIYGYAFLYETFLYHFIRTDHRHNFSPWFYAVYLGLHADLGRVISLWAFLSQALTQIAVMRRFAQTDAVFSFFLQTWAFVAFNKVITAQYFLWYVSLLPVAIFSVKIGTTRLLLTLALPWMLTELHWLAWGYRVEFLGFSSFEGVFIAGLLFFVVNVYMIVTLVRSHSAIETIDKTE